MPLLTRNRKDLGWLFRWQKRHLTPGCLKTLLLWPYRGRAKLAWPAASRKCNYMKVIYMAS
jgi:hypothetical protein